MFSLSILIVDGYYDCLEFGSVSSDINLNQTARIKQVISLSIYMKAKK